MQQSNAEHHAIMAAIEAREAAGAAKPPSNVLYAGLGADGEAVFSGAPLELRTRMSLKLRYNFQAEVASANDLPSQKVAVAATF